MTKPASLGELSIMENLKFAFKQAHGTEWQGSPDRLLQEIREVRGTGESCREEDGWILEMMEQDNG